MDAVFSLRFDLELLNKLHRTPSQYHYGYGAINCDYSAIKKGFISLNEEYENKSIAIPKIGAGLAGGDWNRIKGIIENELRDCQVTVVIYKK